MNVHQQSGGGGCEMENVSDHGSVLSGLRHYSVIVLITDNRVQFDAFCASSVASHS